MPQLSPTSAASPKRKRSGHRTTATCIARIFFLVAVGFVVVVNIQVYKSSIDLSYLGFSSFDLQDFYMNSSAASTNGNYSVTSTKEEVNTTDEEQPPTVDPEMEPLLKILRQAKYRIFQDEVLDSLPKWSTINSFYGPPKILGLETCKEYQKINILDRVAGVAGTFNSGTNLLYNMLYK